MGEAVLPTCKERIYGVFASTVARLTVSSMRKKKTLFIVVLFVYFPDSTLRMQLSALSVRG